MVLRLITLVLGATAALVISIAPARAAAAFNQIYVFGDSLSDVGNIYTVTGGVQPRSPPYYQGRFSNGPLWIEDIASTYGLTLVAAKKGGTDYAYGGAEVTFDVQSTNGVTIPSLPHQVGLYLAGHAHADAAGLYVIWGGGNDVNNHVAAPAGLQAKFVTAMVGMITQLHAAGARSFLIPSVPDVGSAPEALGYAAAATKLATSLNKALDAKLKTVTGVTIYRIDPFHGLDAIIAAKTHFGFNVSVTSPCLSGQAPSYTICKDPDGTLFWDAFHPNAFGHAMIAVEATAVLP